MDLRDIQAAFASDAARLGDYSLMTKTELANGYCDADEAAELAREANNESEVQRQESLRSSYYAALMLRYWHKIFEWMQNSASLHLESTDFIDWLSDSLYVAFYYRTWRYEFVAIVQHGKFIDWSRDENGELTQRKDLLKVPKLGQAAFKQCAGFIRIFNGKNPLEVTGVHPESYKIAEQLLTFIGYEVLTLYTLNSVPKLIIGIALYLIVYLPLFFKFSKTKEASKSEAG